MERTSAASDPASGPSEGIEPSLPIEPPPSAPDTPDNARRNQKRGFAHSICRIADSKWDRVKSSMRSGLALLSKMKHLAEEDKSDFIAENNKALDDAKCGGSAVVLVAASAKDIKKVNYMNQGDASCYTPDAMERRRSLRNQESIISKVKEWWDFLPRAHEGEPTVHLPKQVYCAMVVVIQLVLLPMFGMEADRKYDPEEDWIDDNKGLDVMPYPNFFDGLFELADMWSDGVEAQDYADLLGKILEDSKDMERKIGLWNNVMKRFGVKVPEGWPFFDEKSKVPTWKHSGATPTDIISSKGAKEVPVLSAGNSQERKPPPPSPLPPPPPPSSLRTDFSVATKEAFMMPCLRATSASNLARRHMPTSPGGARPGISGANYSVPDRRPPPPPSPSSIAAAAAVASSVPNLTPPPGGLPSSSSSPQGPDKPIPVLLGTAQIGFKGKYALLTDSNSKGGSFEAGSPLSGSLSPFTKKTKKPTMGRPAAFGPSASSPAEGFSVVKFIARKNNVFGGNESNERQQQQQQHQRTSTVPESELAPPLSLPPRLVQEAFPPVFCPSSVLAGSDRRCQTPSGMSPGYMAKTGQGPINPGSVRGGSSSTRLTAIPSSVLPNPKIVMVTNRPSPADALGSSDGSYSHHGRTNALRHATSTSAVEWAAADGNSSPTTAAAPMSPLSRSQAAAAATGGMRSSLPLSPILMGGGSSGGFGDRPTTAPSLYASPLSPSASSPAPSSPSRFIWESSSQLRPSSSSPAKRTMLSPPASDPLPTSSSPPPSPSSSSWPAGLFAPPATDTRTAVSSAAGDRPSPSQKVQDRAAIASRFSRDVNT